MQYKQEVTKETQQNVYAIDHREHDHGSKMRGSSTNVFFKNTQRL